MESGDFPKRQVGRSRSNNQMSPCTSLSPILHKTLRKSVVPFDQSFCFFCQKGEFIEELGKLHDVETKNSGIRLKAAVERLESDIYSIRLSSAIDPADARAIDVKYHLSCWIQKVDRTLDSPDNEKTASREEYSNQVAADSEFFTYLETSSQDKSFMTLASLAQSYKDICKSHNVYHNVGNRYLRSIVKKKIIESEKFPDMEFTK